MTLFSSSVDDTESTIDGSGSEASEKAKRAKRRDAQPESAAGDVAMLAAAASVGFSWYQYYVRGNEEYGVFTGLWAPTILGFASYLKLKSIEDRMENSLLGGSTAQRVKKLLQ